MFARYLIATTFILSAFAKGAYSQTTNPATQQSEEMRNFALLRETLPQLASLDALRAVLLHADRTWIVARVAPHPGQIPPEGFTTHRAEGGILRAGGFEAIASLSPKTAPAADRYICDMPTFASSTTPFNPLWGGLPKTVIAPVDAVNEKAVTLNSAFAIPDGWRTQVAPALKYLKLHRSLLDDPPKMGDADLAALLKGDNSFLAIAAFRTLAISNLADPKLATALAASTDMRRAVYCYILLLPGFGKETPAAAVSMLRSLIQKSRTLDELRPIALVTFLITPKSVPKKPSVGSTAIELLREIYDHPVVKAAGHDPYLSEIFAKVHLLPANAVPPK